MTDLGNRKVALCKSDFCYTYFMTAQLYIVATPIGNLEDITLRALRILKEVDIVLCEDTRVTGRLLHHYEIKADMISYHANSKLSKSDKILSLLQEGKNMALVSDAGTPTISDPGVQLIELVSKQQIEVDVIPIPGASALIAGLSVSGFSGNQFTFFGFIPHKKGRATLFQEMADNERISVSYESPHRIQKTLSSLSGLLSSERQVVIGRELTKMFEQVVRGNAQEVADYFVRNPGKVKGEFVLIIDGK